jgi:hypothetical protein
MKLTDILSEQELVEAGLAAQLKVEKDDDIQTVLVDPTTNTKTVIDKKKNPSAVVQDPNTGKAIMTDKPEPGTKKTPLKPGTMVATNK